MRKATTTLPLLSALLVLHLQTLQVEAWFGKKLTPKNEPAKVVRRRPPPQSQFPNHRSGQHTPPPSSRSRRAADEYYERPLQYPPPPPPPSWVTNSTGSDVDIDIEIEDRDVVNDERLNEDNRVQETQSSACVEQQQQQQHNNNITRFSSNMNKNVHPPNMDPPPPPPYDDSSSRQQLQQSQSSYWEASSSSYPEQQNGNYYYPPPPPPPPQAGYYYPEQQQQQQHQQQQEFDIDYNDDNQQRRQLQQIDEIMRQNDDLIQDLANATEELALRRAIALERLEMVDALTSKLADAEAFAASESNAALEAQMNATELAIHSGRLKKELDCVQEECRDFKEEARRAKEEKEEINDALQEKVEELEEMAASIEMARLKDAQKVLDDRGFFGRLLGSLFSGGSGFDLDRIKAAQELSRNTLMEALKAERNHVEELEICEKQLRQNNTAISEMVSSRDDLINELNDRVQVFEEDKMVLKAALKQLQQEMREDAPKTAQIMFELDSARTEIEVLNEEIAQMRDAHDEEVTQLSGEIGSKQNELKYVEVRMATIANYVDQLEERLATFKVAKREVQEKEKQFKDREETEERQKAEEEKIKAKLQAEVKNLQQRIDTLTEDATSLREDNEELLKQIILLQDEMETLTESLIEMEKERDLAKTIVQEEVIEEFEIATLKQPAGLEEYDAEYDVDDVSLDDYDEESSTVEEPQLSDPLDVADQKHLPQQSSLQRSPHGPMASTNDREIIQKEDDTIIPSVRTVRKAFAKATGMHGFFSSRPLGRQRTTTQLDCSRNGDGRPPSQ